MAAAGRAGLSLWKCQPDIRLFFAGSAGPGLIYAKRFKKTFLFVHPFDL